MKKIILILLLFIPLGCSYILTGIFPSKCYLQRAREEIYFVDGTVLALGWGLDNKASKVISFSLPGGPELAYLYWAGRNQTPLEDSYLFINGRRVKGSLIYAETPGAPPPEIQYIFTVRYEITPFVKKGSNEFKIWGFDAYQNDGLGLIVIYRNQAAKKKIILKDGLGFFWAGLKEKRNSKVLEFLLLPESKEARIIMMFAGGAPSPRDDKIYCLTSEKKIDAEIISKGEVLFENCIESKQGKEWDCIDFEINVPQEAKYLYLQVESPQETATPHKGDSLNFVLALMEQTFED